MTRSTEHRSWRTLLQALMTNLPWLMLQRLHFPIHSSCTVCYMLKTTCGNAWRPWAHVLLYVSTFCLCCLIHVVFQRWAAKQSRGRQNCRRYAVHMPAERGCRGVFTRPSSAENCKQQRNQMAEAWVRQRHWTNNDCESVNHLLKMEVI